MGGGLIQLVAYGAQDIYLTGNPQITFFKVVYRRHTNFSLECIEQTITGSSTAAGGSGTVTISRNGDLVSKVYVRCDQSTGGVHGDKLVADVDIEIGGHRIDHHYEEWNQIWSELTTPESKTAGYKYLTGGFSNSLSGSGTSQASIMVPLHFWFCRNPGLALPLIALQYHEVKLKFTWGAAADTRRTGSHTATCEVWCDYIFLDTDERRRFAQISHEYLIEQVQRQEENSSDTSFKLTFTHPVKEIIWTDSSEAWTTGKAKLQLNGLDRFYEQDREYFQVRQPLDYHTAIPGYNIKETERPQLLSPPTDLGHTAHHSTPSGDTKVDINTTTITYDAAINVSNAGHKVGDILSVSIEPASNEDAAVGGLHMVTDITGAVVTITPGISGQPVDNDSLTISRIARVQDPQSRCSQLDRAINVYSFALKPEEHQPSGTCNFSRIDDAQLMFTTATNVGTIYAVNYNVLRIMGGMGGLSYST